MDTRFELALRLAGRALSALVVLLGLAACAPGTERGPEAAADPEAGRPRVVATTAILGDVVAAVGGEAIELSVLLPPDADPHAFEASPAEARALESADLVFVSGFDLEESLLPLLDDLDPERVVSASRGIAPRRLGGAGCAEGATEDEALGHEAEAEGAAPEHPEEEAGAEPGHAEEAGDSASEHDEGPEGESAHAHSPCAADPHVWLDPTQVARWAETIADGLGEIDPEGADGYARRAADYAVRMDALDAWIQERVATIPPRRRLMVTDHDAYGWFCDRYGLRLVGTILPSYSTHADSSAGDLADLVDSVEALDVPAIFVTRSVDPGLAASLARDTGTELVQLSTGSLAGPEGTADSYESMMRQDVSRIVGALGGEVDDGP